MFIQSQVYNPNTIPRILKVESSNTETGKDHLVKKEIMEIEIDKLTKLYYSIGEVSDMMGLSTSLLRYWEGEFTELKPKKNRKGDRQFTKKDIEVIVSIHKLVKERGFTIEGAKKELKEVQARLKKLAPIIKKMKNIRKELLLIKGQIDTK